MKTIKEPRKNIVLVWGSPKPKQAVYRPLRFLLRTNVEEGLLLYNIVTCEMVLLDDSERELFEGLPAMYSEGMDELISRHFIVTENFDECKSVNQLRALERKLKPPKRINGFTILPTTECNARCYYCFESDFERCTMTKELADDVVDYIAVQGKMLPVEIGWFGGEPLVAHKRISQICEGLRSKGIDYISSMVSNAYLFDSQLIQTAKNDWKLKNVQITLDGTEITYNATKAYVNPKDNPFKRVLNNIEELLANDITVSIRLNVTNSNAEDLSDLIDELEERFKGKKGLSCYSHVVYEGVGYDPLNYDEHVSEQTELATFALDAKLREKKFLGNLAHLPYMRTVHCMADNDGCRLIYPDGTIGRCEDRSSLENIGDIFNGITNIEMDAQYKAVERIPECETCCLYPDCVNLVLCPETGRCSKKERAWKIDRYTELLTDVYKKYIQTGLEEISEGSINNNCEV